MIRHPLALRLPPDRPIRETVRDAARAGARGVVFDALGDLGPSRLSTTGRRELRHLLKSIDLTLVAVSLPTRRGFDTVDQLEDRLRRADQAFAMTYELGANLVLARVGAVPPESEAEARSTFLAAVGELGRRAGHRGVRLAVETGPDAGDVLRAVLDGFDPTGLAASIDPAALLQHGHDPAATAIALGPWVAHAYANDASTAALTSSVARRSGLPAGAVDWEEYLGSLEEVNYGGFLTVWPDPARDPIAQFTATSDRLNAF